MKHLDIIYPYEGKFITSFPLLCACCCKEDREDKDQGSSSEESPDRSRTHSTAQLLRSETYSYIDGMSRSHLISSIEYTSGFCCLNGHSWCVGDGDESEDEDYIPLEEWKKVTFQTS